MFISIRLLRLPMITQQFHCHYKLLIITYNYLTRYSFLGQLDILHNSISLLSSLSSRPHPCLLFLTPPALTFPPVSLLSLFSPLLVLAWRYCVFSLSLCLFFPSLSLLSDPTFTCFLLSFQVG